MLLLLDVLQEPACYHGGVGGGGTLMQNLGQFPQGGGTGARTCNARFNKTESLSFKHKESVISPFNSTSHYHYQLDRISISYN